jgi:uncharacterized protein (DUF983 family)
MSEAAQRNWRQAMGRGFRGKCPHCGEGRLFRAFLKPSTGCERCGEVYEGKHRVDDFAAYVVIFIVGHVTVPLLWPSLVVGLTLLLIQPVKGALIGQQWAMRLHGFDPEGDGDDTGFAPAPRQ